MLDLLRVPKLDMIRHRAVRKQITIVSGLLHHLRVPGVALRPFFAQVAVCFYGAGDEVFVGGRNVVANVGGGDQGEGHVEGALLEMLVRSLFLCCAGAPRRRLWGLRFGGKWEGEVCWRWGAYSEAFGLGEGGVGVRGIVSEASGGCAGD